MIPWQMTPSRVWLQLRPTISTNEGYEADTIPLQVS